MKIAEAYEVLSDEERRRTYDNSGSGNESPKDPSEPKKAPTSHEPIDMNLYVKCSPRPASCNDGGGLALAGDSRGASCASSLSRPSRRGPPRRRISWWWWTSSCSTSTVAASSTSPSRARRFATTAMAPAPNTRLPLVQRAACRRLAWSRGPALDRGPRPA